MNPDLYSDIKEAERLFYQPSLYLLTMFENKIDSFFSNKAKHAKQRQKDELRDEKNIISFYTHKEDPLKALGKDLTKPVWNCQTKSEPLAICAKPRPSNGKSPEVFGGLCYVFIRFLERLINEHQDEGSLQVRLRVDDKAAEVAQVRQMLKKRQSSRVQLALQKLLELMGRLIRHQDDIIASEREVMSNSQSCRWGELRNQAARAIIQPFFKKDKHQEYTDCELTAELISFTETVTETLRNVIECHSGPTLLNIWPETGMLSELLHPGMVGVYTLIQQQSGSFDELPKDTFSRAYDTHRHIEEEHSVIFDQLKSSNCSKITFINLDGYESRYNLILAKYLHRCVQYVSFPLENETGSQEYDPYFRDTSGVLLREYMASQMEGEEVRADRRVYSMKEGSPEELRQHYRNLLVLPLHSLRLREAYGAGEVELLQSWACRMLMQEVVVGEVRSFNPSVVIISYSNKLQLADAHFEEIVRELTVVSNMRVVLYNNCSRAHTYHQYEPAPNAHPHLRNYHQLHKYEHKMHDQMMCPYRASCQQAHQQLNCDLLDKLAIFLSVSSGTRSLSSGHPPQCPNLQFANQQVMRYAGDVLRLLGECHPTLTKYSNRSREYIRIGRMLSQHHETQHCNAKQNNNLRQGLPSQYHLQVLNKAEELMTNKQHQYHWIGQYAERIYGSQRPMLERWNEFRQFWTVQTASTYRRQQHKTFIPVGRFQPDEDDQGKSTLIAIQFELEGQSTSVCLQNSQVCTNSRRQSPDVLIYLFNHLPSGQSAILKNYMGVFGRELERSEEGRVQLREVGLAQDQCQLNLWQHFTQFNYHETAGHVILYWPTLYDQVMALLHQFVQRKYQPTPTSLIFVGSKMNPCQLTAVTPSNPLSLKVIPRTNCVSYQVPGTDYIYILGGFYHSQNNYLLFQKDITLMRFVPNNQNSLMVETVPKHFHFEFEPTQSTQASLPHVDSRTHRITRIHNDLVRPRAEYQLMEIKRTPEQVQVMLFGGVGQKFLQPYSLIGTNGHVLTFKRNGQITGVRRVKLNNLVPVNLRSGVRTKNPMELPTVLQAQNRRIYTEKQEQDEGSVTYSWFDMAWQDNDRMKYEKQYEVCVLQNGQHEVSEGQEHFVMTRQGKTRVVLRHYQGESEFDTVVAVCKENGRQDQVFRMELKLTDEAYNQFVNMEKPQVPLSGPTFVSAGIFGLQMYTVLHHSEYTFGRSILAHFDLTSSLQSLLESDWLLEQERPTLELRQVYQFDCDMKDQALVALPQQQIAFLHGYPLFTGEPPRQILMTRTPQGSFIYKNIHSRFKEYPQLPPPVPHSNSLSFFGYSKQQLHCWTIYTIGRNSYGEEVLLLHQEMALGEVLEWRFKRLKPLRLGLPIPNYQNYPLKMTILDIKAVSTKHEIWVGWRDEVFSGWIDLYPQGDSPEVIKLAVAPEMTTGEYYRQKRTGLGYHANYLCRIDKHPHEAPVGMMEPESQ